MLNSLRRVLLDNPRPPREHDPEWDSPCRTSAPDDRGWIQWSPVPIVHDTSFAEAEALLEAPIEATARDFLSRFLAGEVSGLHSGFSLTLGVAWNLSELESKISKLAEHLTTQKHERLPYTIPIASTDYSDVFFSVVNASGIVVLQNVGRSDQVIAPSLKVFLDAIWQPDRAGRPTSSGRSGRRDGGTMDSRDEARTDLAVQIRPKQSYLVKNDTFERLLGFPTPPAILELCDNKLRSAPLPMELRFRHVPHLLEIQHLRSLADEDNYDAPQGLLCFAVTSDGNDLLVDVRSPDMPILQRENGEIDPVGLKVADLLIAECSPSRDRSPTFA